MKVLYIDTALDGHHIAYMKELIDCNQWKSEIVLPDKTEELDIVQYTYQPTDMKNKTLRSFYSWMKEVAEIANRVKPDIVHFLMADNFYKYFGLGLFLFRKYKTVATLHWVRPGFLKQLSIRVFSSALDTLVVHSEYLDQQVKSLGVKCSKCVVYPQFKRMKDISCSQAKQFWNLQEDLPVIACVGNTREDKGLDILLDAMKYVDMPFQILIAGKPEAFTEDFIDNKAKEFKHPVSKALRYLTDEEIEMAINAADIIALPYRQSFNGASGPLVEGVWRGKCIIGSDHANLGDTIKRNHLGYTFADENPENLAKVLNEWKDSGFVVDSVYSEYKEQLNPESFVKSYKAIYQQLCR